ncbi:MAG: formimidoylglutamase [Bacteroidales bacterium]
MDLQDYFIPLTGLPDEAGYEPGMFGWSVKAFRDAGEFPDLTDTDLAIIGAGEERNASFNSGCSAAPDEFRKAFYPLYRGNFKPRIADLGNLKNGHTVEDTYFALSHTISHLMAHDIIPVVIGGSQDLTLACYQAYEHLGKVINLLHLDSRFDLGRSSEPVHSHGYLNHIIMRQPNYLFNYINLGYQTYLVSPDSVSLMNKLLFDVRRLGEIRGNITEAEPEARSADLISVDMSVVRQADAPGNHLASPNGFSSDEICQIMKYAGLSDHSTCLGIFEINPELDRDGQTARLAAQMVWSFIDGYYARVHDFPFTDNDRFVKYTVTIHDHGEELVFNKSKKSERWWMDVPVSDKMKTTYERHHLVPCSYADYEAACRNEIPDRWWQAYQKLM